MYSDPGNKLGSGGSGGGRGAISGANGMFFSHASKNNGKKVEHLKKFERLYFRLS
jgi:hypothetical protein